jgi:molecular chaperone GrpE
MTESEQRGAPGSAAAAEAGPGRTADSLLDSLQRERADFLNYKRRIERERARDRESAQADVIRALLPMLDELDRALAQIPADLASHPWARGIALSRDGLTGAFSDLGVERIGVPGEPFDPSHHEALYFDTRPDATDQRVSTVIKPGYRLGDRLLRAAQVGVVGPAEQHVAADMRSPHRASGGAHHAAPGRTGAGHAVDDARRGG